MKFAQKRNFERDVPVGRSLSTEFFRGSSSVLYQAPGVSGRLAVSRARNCRGNETQTTRTGIFGTAKVGTTALSSALTRSRDKDATEAAKRFAAKLVDAAAPGLNK